MSEFFNTTSKPVGHGFTRKMVRDGFACYHFYPKANIPIKVIVLDDTDKVGCGAAAALDYERYGWLIQELDDGEVACELMIICAHVPIRPYAAPQDPPPPNNPLYPLETTSSPQSDISEDELLAKLHSYKNLILWCAEHIHRNTITPQPSPDGDPEYGFWEVMTPSLRDFPRMFRRFEIVRNSDNKYLNLRARCRRCGQSGPSPGRVAVARVDIALLRHRNPADFQQSGGAGTACQEALGCL